VVPGKRRQNAVSLIKKKESIKNSSEEKKNENS